MGTDNFKAKEVAVFPECGEEGNRVRVYRNLHKDCWSVKNFEPRHPLYNRVVAHAEEVPLISSPEPLISSPELIFE